MIIKNIHTRSKLSEGRSHGLGFGFAKKIGKREFASVMPLSPCKDYLNDVVYTQNTKSKPKTIYGFEFTYEDNLFGKFYSYLMIKVEPYKSKEGYENMEEEQDALENNYNSICKFINFLEEKFPFKARTKVLTFDKESSICLLKIPSFWVKETYLISLYSAIVRAGLRFAQNDFKMNPLEFLENKKYKPNDIGIWSKALPRMKKMFSLKKSEFPSLNYTVDTSIGIVHNYGIASPINKILD